MGNENEFIKGYINFNILSEEDKKLIMNIPYIDFTYICNKCNKIPKINIEYNYKDGYIEKLYFEECNTEININLNDKSNFLLKKKDLNSLYKENFMNIKYISDKTYLKNKSLPFRTKDDLKEYIRVYKSYLKLRNEIKKYNSGDTKKNKVFSLFEDLLSIGLYGLGSENEYKNSIIIKDFLFDKFKVYNSEIALNNKYSLINHGIIYFHNASKIKHLKKNIYSIKYYNKNNTYFNTYFFISKIDSIDDIYLLRESYTEYHKANSYTIIPKELRKNFIIFDKTMNMKAHYLDCPPKVSKKNNEKNSESSVVVTLEKLNHSFKDIIMVGKDKYMISTSNLYLFIFIFDENLNEYTNKMYILNLENGYKEEMVELYSLKNNNIIIITLYSVLIYEFNQNNNNLKYIKHFFGINKDRFNQDSENSIKLYELKNGDFIFNFPTKIFCVSGISYEIKSIINFNKWINFSFNCDHEMIVGCNEILCHLNLKNLKFFIEKKYDKYNNFYIHNNIVFYSFNKYFEMRDSKTSKLIYEEKFLDDYYFNNLKFNFVNKKENIFFLSFSNVAIMAFKIYQIKYND